MGSATASTPEPRRRGLVIALAVAVAVLAVAVVGLAIVVRRGDDDGAASSPATSSTITTATSTTAAPPTTTTAPATTQAPPSADEDGRFPGNVTRAYVAADGSSHLEIDYVLFYTGDEARAQAAARGQDAPNDIFIVNDNPRLRDFRISDGTTVTLVCFAPEPGCTGAGDGALATRTIPVEQWIAQGGAGDPSGLWGRASDLFHVTVDGGEVVAIEEQYVP